MKIYLVFYLSIFGNPPSVMPEYEDIQKKNYIYFNDKVDCENYLIKISKKKYKYMQINSSGNGKYLKNSKDSQFIICKEFYMKKIVGFNYPK